MSEIENIKERKETPLVFYVVTLCGKQLAINHAIDLIVEWIKLS